MLLLILPLGLLGNQAASAQTASAASVSEITKGLMCTCGCTMVLYSCQCGTAAAMNGDIQEMIDAGMSEEAILNSYVEQHGQQILAAPPKEGFNLSAWVIPFAALAAAAIFVVVLLRRWTRTHEEAISEPSEPTEEDRAYLKALEHELELTEE